MVRVIPLAHQHVAIVSAMHQTYLPTSLSGVTGRHLLCNYYEIVRQGQGACGFVAEDGSRPVGYVCGVWDSKALRRSLLQRRLLSLAWWGALHVIERPRLLQMFLMRTRGISDGPADTEGYELRPIVVLPEARGSCAAQALVNRLIEHARTIGVGDMHLYTEVDNLRARRFYTKMGFQQMGMHLQGTVNYIRYVLPISGSLA
jgi:GNAT superfamily N-acetyltransferase